MTYQKTPIWSRRSKRYSLRSFVACMPLTVWLHPHTSFKHQWSVSLTSEQQFDRFASGTTVHVLESQMSEALFSHWTDTFLVMVRWNSVKHWRFSASCVIKWFCWYRSLRQDIKKCGLSNHILTIMYLNHFLVGTIIDSNLLVCIC